MHAASSAWTAGCGGRWPTCATSTRACAASSRRRAASGTRSRACSTMPSLQPLTPIVPPEGGGGILPFRHLYVHIPFCKHKCGYCDFNAYAGMDRLMPDYVGALERELSAAREQRPFTSLETVYFGGGTPSLLPAELIA